MIETNLRTRVLLSVLAVSLGLAMPRDVAAGAADLILFGGRVVTLEATGTVEAIAVSGERILAVGTSAEMRELAGPGSRVVDLQGRAVLPGFIDGHVHLLAARGDLPLVEAIEVGLSHGLTTLNELAVAEDLIFELFELESAGRLRARVNLYPEYNHSWPDESGKSIYFGQWYPANAPIRDPTRRVRIPGIKVFVDGAYNPPEPTPRGCPALTRPYAESFRSDPLFQIYCSSDRGALFLNADELTAIIRDAQDAGYQVAMHAMGDAGVDTALEAVHRALAGTSNRHRRHQIHHNILLRRDQLRAYRRVGAIASARAYFNTCGQEFTPYFFGEHRTPWAGTRYALPRRTLTVGEGDFGWTGDPGDQTQTRQLNPLVNLYGLVTRQRLQQNGEVCEPESWLSRHQIRIERALRMLTIDPAFATFQDDVIGSLKAAKLADLVILTEDPLQVAPDRLPEIEVLATIVGGWTEFCNSEADGRLCAALDESP